MKIGISLAGRRCWIGALWVVTLLKPFYLSIKLSDLLLYAGVNLMNVFISVFDLSNPESFVNMNMYL